METYQKIENWLEEYKIFIIILFIIFLIYYLYQKKYLFEYFEYFENSQVRYKVIHMKGKQDRLDNIKKQEETAGIQIDIFDAVVGANLDIPQLQKDGLIKSPWDTYMYNKEPDKEKKKKVRNGEIGCYMSHLHLLDEISKDNFDGWTVIFEDDLLLNSNFKSELQKIIDTINPDFDIIYLGNTHQHDCNKGVYKNNLCYPDVPYGTQAYMVNKRSSKKIHELLTYIDDPIDVKYSNLMKNNQIKGLVVVPTLVKQNREDNPSTINEHYKS